MFFSIVDLPLLNNFLKNENQVFFFLNFFHRLSTQFLNIKNFKINSCSAKNFHKWRSKSSKAVIQCSKKTFFSTLNANNFQSTRSNFMKFLPYDLRQVKYKILWLDSNFCLFVCFLRWTQQKGQFWVVIDRKWPRSFRG